MTGSGPGEVADGARAGRYDEVLRLTDAILAETPGRRCGPRVSRARPARPRPARRGGASRAGRGAARSRGDPLSRAAGPGPLARGGPSRRGGRVRAARAQRSRARRPGRWRRPASDSAPRSPRWASRPRGAPCSSIRATVEAQLALAQALTRTGDARGAFQAASLAAELLPGDPEAREALADAQWLAGQEAAAFEEFRALANDLDRQRPRPRRDARRARSTGVRPASGSPRRRHRSALRARVRQRLARIGR